MEQDEKVSIIMPTYMGEKVIEKAIKSVLNQSYRNIELIVIENGKKDNTQQICQKLNKEDKIKYIYEENPNVSKARTIGIKNASGRYIAFIDSDDEYESNYIEKMLNNLKDTKSQLVTCGYKTVHERIIRKVENFKEIENTEDIQKYLETLKESYLFNELWNKLYIASIIKENNIQFNQYFELGEDFIFNLEYLKYIKKASYLNEPLYVYTDGNDGLKLKYRKDKFEIEYNLTVFLEKFYKEQNFSMEYVYNRFARVYYNGIINIYSDNNPSTKKEKEIQLEKFINSEKYKKDLNFLRDKITEKKFKIAVNHFFLRGKMKIKLFVFLNKIRKKN